MSQVLILYGTTDGHTRKIAHAIAQPLSQLGIRTSVVEAGGLNPQPCQYDGVIVAASVHAGRYQKAVEQWVRAHKDEFDAKPSAFLSVCLGVLQRSDLKVQADLDAIVKRFKAMTGWRPPIVKQVAGALMYSRYNFLKRWIMKRIAAKAGGATDVTRDHEYTDWTELRAFAEDFGRRLQSRAA